MDFISMFLKFTRNYESPTSFWKWSAYTGIAAILRDNVYWMQGADRQYTNMYVLLLADSGMHRKGNPVKHVTRLISKLKATKVISGRSSIQAIMDELSQATTDQLTGKPIRGGSCLLSFEELAASFVLTPEVVHLLTGIYDFQEEYPVRLKGNVGIQIIHNLCVTMLAASNEFLLKDVYTMQAVYGGLLGRTFVIKADEFRKGNSLLNTDQATYDIKPLLESLAEIHKVKGQIIFEDAAIKEYDSWYYPLRERYKTSPDRTGVLQRIHTGVLKIAIVLCVAKSLALTVNKSHIEESIDECSKLLENYEAYAMASGRSNLAQAGSLFLIELSEKGGTCTRKEIMRKFWTEFDAETLDKLVNTLSVAGYIEMGINSNEVSYSLTDKAKEKFDKQNEKENGRVIEINKGNEGR